MTTTTTAEARVGQALPPLAKTIDQRRIDGYSGVRPHSIHTRPDWAKARGFKAPLAQAMMSTAYVSELMMRLLGEGFVKGGTLSMAFIKPVFAGDPLTVHGVVKERREEAGVTRVVVEVWCENQDGEKTAVGTASGVIR